VIFKIKFKVLRLLSCWLLLRNA